MDDHSYFDPAQDPQVQRIFNKLSYRSSPKNYDKEVAALFPGFEFGIRLVAGITPIEKGGPLDFPIDRPNGMHGWIINLTVDGQGKLFDGKNTTIVKPGDIVLFPPDAQHLYGRDPEADKWWHRWIYFQPRAFWKPWLQWDEEVNGAYIMRHREESRFSELFRLFVEVEKWAGLSDSLSADLAFNRLEHILLFCARMNRAEKKSNIEIDERVLAACTLISNNLDKPLTVNEIASHVCLSPFAPLSPVPQIYSAQASCNGAMANAFNMPCRCCASPTSLSRRSRRWLAMTILFTFRASFVATPT